ncbi:methylaspartate mutase [Plantactinospora endophytica]|uniref:Methylaspartate mutase n=1 Tax=Plantactinospora endophytica TaxID=673535 RepID=A0ABQ4E6K4_9ACTN|nr:methylaspartate mutase [Plantactinospora endophytica]GIG90340.1 methylaspartate mutase [Plantactinospora endophytica]
MAEFPGLEVSAAVAARLPDWDDIVAYLRNRPGDTVPDVLRAADRSGVPAIQPRCGVGGHAEMLALLRELALSAPSVLSVTIDSYTRLRQFDVAARVLAEEPARLNGYPLVAHGWQRGRELADAVPVPLEVRHGSPDGRDLFATALAAGITSFEGGGIGYNLPYCKDVPLDVSLRSWQQVDAACGALADAGVLVDRELFGTLTAVLVPPSISLAVTLLEAVAAAREGVRCISISYPQGGEIHQDVAALRAVRTLAARYLDPRVEVFPVLHQFMGAFPADPAWASGLILHGALTARLGGASKVVNKTEQEARGLPDADANGKGIRLTAVGASSMFDFVELDADRVAEELHWIEEEVAELVEPVLAEEDLLAAIGAAFRTGRLDVPFSASVHARNQVIPRRDPGGAIRYADHSALPFSGATRRRHAALLAGSAPAPRPGPGEITAVIRDISYFADRTPARTP